MATGGGSACEKYCHINSQTFTLGNQPNLERLWKNGPLKQKPEYVYYYYHYYYYWLTSTKPAGATNDCSGCLFGGSERVLEGYRISPLDSKGQALE